MRVYRVTTFGLEIWDDVQAFWRRPTVAEFREAQTGA